MALSDTAALVASLELQDKFSATANKFDRTIGGMERQMSTFGRVSGQVSAGIGQASQNLQRIGLIGVGVLTANVAAGIQTIARLEEVMTATSTVIESTGGVAGQTAEDIRRMSEEFESLNATIDDKVIQSAANLLLTFTNINEDAFEPALEAALNLNQALGGGEEGLQGTLIQVAKALNDPARGLTALRRSGVSFTQAQIDQIKALQEANDLFGAQSIILDELSNQFGNQFARAGETATARFAAFKDAIEDAQVALATALLPVLDKVVVKLTALLQDPEAMEALEEVGENLADAFDSVVEIAGNLPWTAIGDAFKLMGTGSKALLEAFTSLPPWVQTAVLTGWGLNKLTGGALGSIVSTLASGLIKGVLGINAGVVNINAGTVTGGAPGAGGGGLGGAAAGVIGTVGVTAAVGGGVLALQAITSGTEEGVKKGFAASSQGFAGLIGLAVGEAIGDPLGDLTGATKEGLNKTTGSVKGLEGPLARLLEEDRKTAGAVQDLRAQGPRSLAALQAIAAKKLSTTVNVKTNVVSNVSITDVTRRLTSQRIAQGVQGGVTVE